MEENKGRRLGKGLSELLGEARENMQSKKQHFNEEVKSEPLLEAFVQKNDNLTKAVMMLPVEVIRPNFNQPRQIFKSEEVHNLAVSIKEFGIIQPLLVNKLEDGGYMIVAGERRWRAAQIAGLSEVPALLTSYSDMETLEVGLIENIQRANLSPLDEAVAYYNLMHKFELTQNEIATRLGKSRSYIANMMRLLELDDSIKLLLTGGELSIGHARALIGRKDAVELAQLVVSKSLSVRQLEKIINIKKDIVNNERSVSDVKKDEDTKALESDLSVALGVEVKINVVRPGKGSVVISYNSLEQLDEICKRLCQAAIVHE